MCSGKVVAGRERNSKNAVEIARPEVRFRCEILHASANPGFGNLSSLKFNLGESINYVYYIRKCSIFQRNASLNFAMLPVNKIMSLQVRSRKLFERF